ncbi:MAG: hypothetical protein ACJ8DU_07060 [Microvirga sp.]
MSLRRDVARLKGRLFRYGVPIDFAILSATSGASLLGVHPPARLTPVRNVAWLTPRLCPSMRRMPYELLAELSFSWPHALAATAMAFSACGLFTALRLSRLLKRKVDGALGELPPNFALFIANGALPAREGMRTLELRVDNYNRRPIRITSLRVRQPRKIGLAAYHLAGLHDILLGDMNRRRDEVLASLVVEGTPPGAQDFNSARLKLVLSGNSTAFDDRKATAIAIRVDYELLQDVPEPKSQVVHLDLRPVMRMKDRVSPQAGGQRLVPAE